MYKKDSYCPFMLIGVRLCRLEKTAGDLVANFAGYAKISCLFNQKPI
jgi:hypothetical protein